MTDINEKYYPGLNKLLVELKETPATSILDLGSAKLAYGKIKSIGAIKDRGEFPENIFNVGDFVYFLPQSGFLMELPEGSYKLLNITEVLVGERNN